VISGDYGVGPVRREDTGEIRIGAFETSGAGTART
jgi:hypothetical protein